MRVRYIKHIILDSKDDILKCRVTTLGGEEIRDTDTSGLDKSKETYKGYK